MSATERVRWLLTLGLTEHQARTYVTALDRPGAPAGALARLSGVPRNRVYDAIDELRALGLMDVTLGPQREHFARPLGRFLDGRASDLRRSIEDIERQRTFVASAFDSRAPVTPGRTEGRTFSVVGRAAVAREIDRMVESARAHVVAMASPGGASRLVRHIAPAVERGLSVTLLVPRSAREDGAFDASIEHGRSIVWVDEEVPSISFVTDTDEAIVVDPVPDDAAHRMGMDRAVLTTRPAFVRERLAFLRLAASPSSAHKP